MRVAAAVQSRVMGLRQDFLSLAPRLRRVCEGKDFGGRRRGSGSERSVGCAGVLWMRMVSPSRWMVRGAAQSGQWACHERSPAAGRRRRRGVPQAGQVGLAGEFTICWFAIRYGRGKVAGWSPFCSATAFVVTMATFLASSSTTAI